MFFKVEELMLMFFKVEEFVFILVGKLNLMQGEGSNWAQGISGTTQL